MKRQKSYAATPQTASRKWVLIDVKDHVLGRAATKIAEMLRGKHRPTFTPHVDAGDFVIVINASQVRLTGKKWDDKISYSYSGYPGGLKERSAHEVMTRHPDELLRNAVWGMMPKNRLSEHLMKKLKIYPGAEHPHVAQLSLATVE